MPSGYGGQLVALNTLLPSEQQGLVAQSDLASTQARVGKATAPYAIAQAKEQARQSQLKTAADEITTAKAEEFEANRQKNLQWEQDHKGQAPAETQRQPTFDEAFSNMDTPLASVSPTAPGPPVKLETRPTFTPEIDNAIKFFNTGTPKGAAAWDARFRQLAQVQPQAAQLIGQYDKRQMYDENIASNRVEQIPAAVKSELATRAGPASPLAVPSDNGNPYRARMISANPDEAAKIFKGNAIAKFAQTKDIEDLKADAPDIYRDIITVTTLMNKDQREAYTHNAGIIGSLSQEVIDTAAEYGQDHQRTRSIYDHGIKKMVELKLMTPQQAAEKLAAPIDWNDVYDGRVRAYTVLQGLELAQKGATARAAAASRGDFQYVGNSPEGYAQRFNKDTGEFETTNVVVGAKPSVATSAHNAKQAVYLKVHPGDTDGALNYANGNTTMTPDEKVLGAQRVAADLQQSTMDPNFNVATVTQTLLQQQDVAVAAAQAGGGGGGGGGGASTVRVDPNSHPALKGKTPAALAVVNDRGWTVAQSLILASALPTWTKATEGDKDHPIPVKSNDDLIRVVPIGKHFVGPDGVIRKRGQ